MKQRELHFTMVLIGIGAVLLMNVVFAFAVPAALPSGIIAFIIGCMVLADLIRRDIKLLESNVDIDGDDTMLYQPRWWCKMIGNLLSLMSIKPTVSAFGDNLEIISAGYVRCNAAYNYAAHLYPLDNIQRIRFLTGNNEYK